MMRTRIIHQSLTLVHQNSEDNCVNHILKFSENRVLKLGGRWLHEPDESDRLNASHCRDTITCSFGELKTSSGIQFVELAICRVSFIQFPLESMTRDVLLVFSSPLARPLFSFFCLFSFLFAVWGCEFWWGCFISSPSWFLVFCPDENDTQLSCVVRQKYSPTTI